MAGQSSISPPQSPVPRCRPTASERQPRLPSLRSPERSPLNSGERDITVNVVALEVDKKCVPQRVTDVIAYLLSDQARVITGQVICIDNRCGQAPPQALGQPLICKARESSPSGA